MIWLWRLAVLLYSLVFLASIMGLKPVLFVGAPLFVPLVILYVRRRGWPHGRAGILLAVATALTSIGFLEALRNLNDFHAKYFPYLQSPVHDAVGLAIILAPYVIFWVVARAEKERTRV